jgi:uncharacterized iron-regulated protein
MPRVIPSQHNPTILGQLKPATKFFPILLALLCWLGHPAYAAAALDEPEVTRSGQQIALPDLWADLQTAQVLYLGETHDQPADHQAQKLILEQLLTGPKPLTLAMEMFQRSYQGVIDRYFKGDLTEAEFLAQTEYKTRWGFPWELYAPIVTLAKTQNIPLIALNTPSEVTRQVARKGLESLTPEQRQFIPAQADIFLGPEGYRQQIQRIYTEMHQGKGNSAGGDRFFQAQVLWDETMADRITQAARQNPQTIIVVLVGQGHLLQDYGIPARVARRLPNIQQRTILLNPENPAPAADYHWVTLAPAADKSPPTPKSAPPPPKT